MCRPAVPLYEWDLVRAVHADPRTRNRRRPRARARNRNVGERTGGINRSEPTILARLQR
jgi:hypothetical protein